jgi:integrase
MTQRLGRDPSRACKPVNEWPVQDRDIWQAALLPGDVFDEDGCRARHSDFSNREVAKGYGRWLAWLDCRGLLEIPAAPGDRITRARVRDYMTDLAKHNATGTMIARLIELKVMAAIMDPRQDWCWISKAAASIRVRHKPVRPKLYRIVDAKELFDFGRDLMDGVIGKNPTARRLTAYRDGLTIAFLAARALRLRNLADLTLDRTLVRRDDMWWIQFTAAETKTKEPIEEPWPDALVHYLELYLAVYRPALLRSDGKFAVGGPLWVSSNGTRMSRTAIYQQVNKRTREGLGHRVNPHLFRDCFATTIAIKDPAHVGIVPRVLGQRSSFTMERHYNHASAVEANRMMQSLLLSLGESALDTAAPTAPNERPATRSLHARQKRGHSRIPDAPPNPLSRKLRGRVHKSKSRS